MAGKNQIVPGVGAFEIGFMAAMFAVLLVGGAQFLQESGERSEVASLDTTATIAVEVEEEEGVEGWLAN